MRNITILSQIQASMTATINAAAYSNARISGGGFNTLGVGTKEADKPLYNTIKCGTSKCGTKLQPYEEYCQKR